MEKILENHMETGGVHTWHIGFRGTFLVFLIIRITVFWGLYSCALTYGNILRTQGPYKTNKGKYVDIQRPTQPSTQVFCT